MKNIFVFLFLILITNYKVSGNSEFSKMNYAVSLIPNGLRNDAKAVTRQYKTIFEVKDNSYAIEKVVHAVTIFNKAERDNGVIVISYDKFREIEELEGKIYDADGEEVYELESKDIKDNSNFRSYSLYDDSRVRIAEMYYDTYPYTVEFYYEISYNGYLGWPKWYAQGNLDPVQESSLEVLMPENKTLRYWCNIDSIQPNINQRGRKISYLWKEQNLPKLSRDVVGDDIEDITTIVYIAPDKFEIEERPGDMTSWKNFGSWCYNLYKDKDNLPEEAKKKIQSLIKPEDNIVQKIQKLYSYMQSRTRYVSIQLGIGGWEPFDAKFVHERGYGDCKALSNYMITLLKDIGIEAFPVLIRTGDHRYPMIKHFPSNQFNHVIVCVPIEQDTVWLECTSQTIPFNHIGRGTENRPALMITPHGGVVVNTPASNPHDNTQLRKAMVNISSFGNADVNAIVTWHGDQQDRVRNILEDKSPKEIEKWVTNSLDIPNLDLKSHVIIGLDTPQNGITLTSSCIAKRYGSVAGNRLFFNPNMMEKRTYVPPNIEKRLSPVRFYYPYYDVDTIIYSIPNEFIIEMLPNEAILNSSFGEFISKTELNTDGKIVFTRSLKIDKYEISADSYDEYKNFFAEIVKADRMQVVLVRKSY